MKFSIVDDFVNLAYLLLMLDDLEFLKQSLSLLRGLIRWEKSKHLPVEAKSALFLSCFCIKFRADQQGLLLRKCVFFELDQTVECPLLG